MTALFETVSFQREHHTAILNVLRAIDGDLLDKSKCYFGGGTAIVLNLGEYRESVDIDFLCADKDGYRELRTRIANKPNLDNILRRGAKLNVLRDVRADQYGLRTLVESNGTKIQFEIVKESRIDLSGSIDPRFGVPVLDQHLMYAEKLLANSDRYYAPEVLSRDIIDLSAMISRWGPVPDSAWKVAKEAYGEKIRDDYDSAIDKIRVPEHMETCALKMAINAEVVEEILKIHGGSKPSQPSRFD